MNQQDIDKMEEEGLINNSEIIIIPDNNDCLSQLKQLDVLIDEELQDSLGKLYSLVNHINFLVQRKKL